MGCCPFLSIFVGQLVHLIEAEHRAVLAHILGADIAPAALADAALHPQLQSGIDLLHGKAHFLQTLQTELNHNGRAAQNGGTVGIEGSPVIAR